MQCTKSRYAVSILQTQKRSSPRLNKQMLDVVYHARFIKSATVLSGKHRRKLFDLIERLRTSPYDPLLHTKNLTEPLIGLLSFRIS